MAPWQTRPTTVAVFITAFAAACVLLLALPGETVVVKYVNDLMIFLDGAHRAVSGQVPNRDFHTALGPLVYYAPAAGFLLSGKLAGAMPVGTALFVLALAPAMAHILAARLRPVIAIPVGAFLLLILAAPINLGEAVTALSFGMFYNRIGWAALAALLLMYLPPHAPYRGHLVLDTLCAAFIVLLLLYTKSTYGLVALAFVGFMLLDREQRRWAAPALLATAAVGVLVETFWRSTAAHIADLLLAGKVSGVEGTMSDLGYTFLGNLADYVVFSFIAGLALLKTRKLRDVLFYGFCAVAGFLLVRQNFQGWGIVTLHAGAAVAAETLLRPALAPFAARRWAAAPVLLLIMLLPTIVHSGMALGLHAALASTRSGQEFGLPKFAGLRLVDLRSPGDYVPFSRYLETLQDGARALGEIDANPEKVFVVDFINPFSAGLGLRPARGDSSWLHWERNFDDTHFLPPESLFRDVRIVMDPKWSVEEYTTNGLRRVYGAYLAENFDLVRETEYWRLYVARERPPQSIVAHDPG